MVWPAAGPSTSAQPFVPSAPWTSGIPPPVETAADQRQPPRKPKEEKPQPPPGPPPSNEADLQKIRELEARVRSVEQQIEQRAQASFQQGRQEGESAARREAAAEMDATLQRMARSIEEISGVRQRSRHEAERDVVQLALAVARRILHREISVDPEAIIGLVKAALDKLDIREVHRVRLHPDQVAPMQRYFERMGMPRRLEVIADHSLERGAALLESEHGAMDASVETQLAEIERGFTDLVRHAK